MKKILLLYPSLRLVLLLGPLIPAFLFTMHFYIKWNYLQELENELELVAKKQNLFQKEKEKELVLLTALKKADHFYIDKHVESLSFLEQEIKKWEVRALDEEAIQRKLSPIKNGGNRLLFAEGNRRKAGQMQEVEEKQQHPVEMNEQDVKKLLAIIEGTPISPYIIPEGSPQLIIKDFDLTKKKVSSQEEVFLINMQLIKREPLNNE